MNNNKNLIIDYEDVLKIISIKELGERTVHQVDEEENIYAKDDIDIDLIKENIFYNFLLFKPTEFAKKHKKTLHSIYPDSEHKKNFTRKQSTFELLMKIMCLFLTYFIIPALIVKSSKPFIIKLVSTGCMDIKIILLELFGTIENIGIAGALLIGAIIFIFLMAV